MYYQYATPNEVYFLWLYLKDGVPTLDEILPHVGPERDRAVRVTIKWCFCLSDLVLIGVMTI